MSRPTLPRILEALKPAFNLEGHQLHITNSIGIALYPDDGEVAETLLKNADAALYRADILSRDRRAVQLAINQSRYSVGALSFKNRMPLGSIFFIIAALWSLSRLHLQLENYANVHAIRYFMPQLEQFWDVL